MNHVNLTKLDDWDTWINSFLHYSNICMVFPGGSVVKNLPVNAGDVGSIPRLGRSRGRRNDNPLQYSCLEKIPWIEEPVGLQSIKSQTRLSMHTIYVCLRVCVCTLSHVLFFVTPRTTAHQAPLAMKFFRQEYWREFIYIYIYRLPR